MTVLRTLEEGAPDLLRRLVFIRRFGAAEGLRTGCGGREGMKEAMSILREGMEARLQCMAILVVRGRSFFAAFATLMLLEGR